LRKENDPNLFLDDKHPSNIVIYFKSGDVFANGNESALMPTLNFIFNGSETDTSESFV